MPEKVKINSEVNNAVDFQDIFESYKIKLLTYSMSVLNNNELSEKSVIESFETLSVNFKTVQNLGQNDVLAYLTIINRNICLMLKNENMQYKEIVLSGSDKDKKCEKLSDEEIKDLLTSENVKQLPELYRDVIMMRYYFGFSDRQISKQFGLSVKVIESRLKTAFELLQNIVTENSDDI